MSASKIDAVLTRFKDGKAGVERTSMTPTVSPRIPAPDEVALKPRHGRDDREERLPQWAGSVDILLIADELNAARPELLQ